MTTHIKISAHCAPDKEVEILVSEPSQVIVIQDGETYEQIVFGHRALTLREVVKAGITSEDIA